MTCSRPIARTGPWSALASWILREMSVFPLSSASRVIEMALTARDALPASIQRLLEDVSHVKTSGVIVSSNSAFTYLIASSVCFELSTRFPASSCSCAPHEYMMVRMAMDVSSSWDRPIPTGIPYRSLIFLPALRTSSQLVGPLGNPTWANRSSRQFTGSGVNDGEKAKYFWVLGLYVLLIANSIGLPMRRSHSWYTSRISTT